VKDLTEKQKNIIDFIDDFIDREGMAPTVYEIADHFGIKTSTVFAHLKALQRKNQISRSSKARSISLAGKRHAQRKPMHMSFALSIPLLGRINAGLPSDSPTVNEGSFYISGALAESARQGELFALKVSGESMRDLGIFDGDIVIVKRNTEIRSGDIAVALVDNETTVKSYYLRDDGKIELRPANADFKVQIYDANQVTLQGKVVALQREF